VTPAPTRETPAGRAYNDVRNLARRDGRDSASSWGRECRMPKAARRFAVDHGAGVMDAM